MPKSVSKENLPSKICVVCDRPFTWRKKWERSWDEVTTCSKKCNSERRGAKRDNASVGGRASGGARESAERDAEDEKRAAKLERRLAKEERRARKAGRRG